MFNINGFELLLIVTLFVLLFGPDRLPEVMGQAGRVLRDVRRLTDEATADLRRELDLASRTSSPRRTAPGATSPALRGPAPSVASGARDEIAPTVGHPTERRDSPEDRQPAPSIFRDGRSKATLGASVPMQGPGGGPFGPTADDPAEGDLPTDGTGAT